MQLSPVLSAGIHVAQRGRVTWGLNSKGIPPQLNKTVGKGVGWGAGGLLGSEQFLYSCVWNDEQAVQGTFLWGGERKIWAPWNLLRRSTLQEAGYLSARQPKSKEGMWQADLLSPPCV